MDTPIKPNPKLDTVKPGAWMVTLVCLLWLAVLASAFGVIYSTHITRMNTNILAQEQSKSSELQLQWGRYLLEKSTWAAYARVEKIASDELKMSAPNAKEIVIVAR
ncbi:cell division protein FtsL [Sessilibacter sp. MAH2]